MVQLWTRVERRWALIDGGSGLGWYVQGLTPWRPPAWGLVRHGRHRGLSRTGGRASFGIADNLGTLYFGQDLVDVARSEVTVPLLPHVVEASMAAFDRHVRSPAGARRRCSG